MKGAVSGAGAAGTSAGPATTSAADLGSASAACGAAASCCRAGAARMRPAVSSSMTAPEPASAAAAEHAERRTLERIGPRMSNSPPLTNLLACQPPPSDLQSCFAGYRPASGDPARKYGLCPRCGAEMPLRPTLAQEYRSAIARIGERRETWAHLRRRRTKCSPISLWSAGARVGSSWRRSSVTSSGAKARRASRSSTRHVRTSGSRYCTKSPQDRWRSSGTRSNTRHRATGTASSTGMAR